MSVYTMYSHVPACSRTPGRVEHKKGDWTTVFRSALSLPATLASLTAVCQRGPRTPLYGCLATGTLLGQSGLDATRVLSLTHSRGRILLQFS